MILELVPGDTHDSLAQFAARLDGEQFQAELDRLSRVEWRWGTPRRVRVRPLKAHRHRCTFEIALHTERGDYEVIGKAYSRDRTDLHRAMEVFGQVGLGPDAAFSVPRPLASFPSLALRLEEKVRGPSAQQVFLSGGADERRAAARRCGEWLARFQACAPPGLGKIIDLEAELPRWQAWTEDIARFGEPLAGKALRLLDKLVGAVPPPHAIDNCATHGSYIPDHVILSGPRTAAIDLDQYGAADPAREVGWFVISVQRLAMKHCNALHALDDAVDAFLSAYGALGRAGAVAHADFYRAVECLHRGRRDVVARTPPARDWVEIMLDEALQALP